MILVPSDNVCAVIQESRPGRVAIIYTHPHRGPVLLMWVSEEQDYMTIIHAYACLLHEGDPALLQRVQEGPLFEAPNLDAGT